MSTPSQEPTPTAPGATGEAPDLHKGGAASSPASAEDAPAAAPEPASAAGKASKPAGPRSPAQDRRVSIGLGIIVLGVIAAVLLVYVAKLDPLATALIVLVIGVVGGAVLGRPSRSGRG